MGLEGSEATPEGQCRHHNRHRQHGPNSAERTGTADRPCPASREKRSPAMAGAGSPYLVAALTRADPRAGSDPSSVASSAAAVGEDDGESAEAEDQDRESQPEHRPIEGETRCGVDLARWTGLRPWFLTQTKSYQRLLNGTGGGVWCSRQPKMNPRMKMTSTGTKITPTKMKIAVAKSRLQYGS